MATFNLSRYQQLLAKEDSFPNKTKDFFNDPVVIELMSLESSLETQVFYNNKNSYFVLIQKYLDEIINPNEFRAQFIVMFNEDLKKSHKILENFDELSTFWIDVELDEFSSLFENIHEKCLYAFEFEDQEDAMSENYFRDSIKENFIKIKKCLNEE